MIQNMFRVTPKAFNPINMVFDPATTDEGFGMIDRMMFPVPFQGLITPKGVCVIDRPFPGLGLDMSHEFLGTHRFHDVGVDAVFPLQEPEHNAFARRRSTTFALATSTKVRLIQFDLPLEFPALQLGQMVQRFSQSLIHSGDHLDINAQVLTQSISRLELIEALENRNLPTQATQTFALPTEWAFHIAATGVQDSKRSTENTLAASQKVGRTTKNRVSSGNHAPVLAHHGYETP